MQVPVKASVSTAKSASSMNVTELDDDDDDWLSLPPTLPKLATPVVSSGDRTVQQLRYCMLRQKTFPFVL